MYDKSFVTKHHTRLSAKIKVVPPQRDLTSHLKSCGVCSKLENMFVRVFSIWNTMDVISVAFTGLSTIIISSNIYF